jgi:hypothetical protein
MVVLALSNEPTPPSPAAERFYGDSLRILNESKIPFLLAGTYAVCAYTGISRPTKDLDVFCKAGDYPRILEVFRDLGHEIEIEDERWIAKVFRGEHFFDVIFSSAVAVVPVTEHWFEESRPGTVYGVPVRMVPPTELVWSKVFLKDRYRYDGNDVVHLMLRQHDQIDWKRLLTYMEPYWEVLLTHVINFRFIYPTERECIPRWLLDELLDRARRHADLPAPQTKVCRGRLFSPRDYAIDVEQWGFADVVGAPR